MPNITIDKIEFPVSDVYEAGHEINAAEASTLNQTRRENLRNNFRKTVQKAREGGLTEEKVAELQAAFAKLDAEYDFTGTRRGAGVTRDPVQSEARKIARSIVAEALKSKGIKRDALAEGAFEKKVEEVAALEQVQAEAKKRVESLRNVATVSLEGLAAA